MMQPLLSFMQFALSWWAPGRFERGRFALGKIPFGQIALGMGIVVLVAAGCGADRSPEASYQAAQEHEAAGRFQEALFEYRRAARGEHPAAMYDLATVLRTGTFVRSDGSPRGYVGREPDEAQTWYRKAAPVLREAAAAGSLEAWTMLGEMRYRGYGGPRDTAQALAYWEEAAGRGHAEAQYRLGVARFEAKAYDEAFHAARRAARQQHAAAEAFLAFLYQDGYGTERNPDSAMVWLRRAAAHGDSSAIWQLRALDRAGTNPDSLPEHAPDGPPGDAPDKTPDG
jgi:TPR repeat protein